MSSTDNSELPHFDHQGSGMRLHARWVPWDTDIFGFPVAQITDIEVLRQDQAKQEFLLFDEWCDKHGIQWLSCRLPHDRLKESRFLEHQRFYFVEMVLHPVLENVSAIAPINHRLALKAAAEQDLPAIRGIAGAAFHNERYHIDPGFSTELANLRYRTWVDNAANSQKQRIEVFEDQGRVIGFFIWEALNADTVYWHLTAINPAYHGQGYGRKAWLTMLDYHKSQGCKKVKTTISARNSPVLNLYASLNFHFEPPEMTFHKSLQQSG